MLRNAMVKNPYMKVMVAAGYFDLATPYYAVEYTFNHMGLSPEMHKNITLGLLPVGPHAVYRQRLARQAEARLQRLHHERSAEGRVNQPDRRAFVFAWLPAIFHRGRTELAGVPVRRIRHGAGPHRYLVIHGDEDTAREVLTAFMKDHDGVGYAVTGRTRNVALSGLKIDPIACGPISARKEVCEA